MYLINAGGEERGCFGVKFTLLPQTMHVIAMHIVGNAEPALYDHRLRHLSIGDRKRGGSQRMLIGAVPSVRRQCM